MADPHVATGLIAKRAEIAGQIEHTQDQLRQLVIDLDHIDAAIHIFDPSIELEEIKSRPVPPKHHAFRGEVSRIVLTTLSNAKKPLTTVDIAQRVMAERGPDTANQKLLKPKGTLANPGRTRSRTWRTSLRPGSSWCSLRTAWQGDRGAPGRPVA